jgi:amino acid transporter
MKVFATVQKVIMVLAIVGCTVILLVFTFTSHSEYVQAWNNTAAQFGSIDYDTFLNTARTTIESAGDVLPITWNWYDTFGVMVAGSWLFAYAYCITFIAGEVKRPDKTIILANLFAVLVPAFFMLWLAIVLYNSVGFEFLSAASWVDNSGEALAGYTIPWSTNFVGLAVMITQNAFAVFMMVLSWILFNLWWVALSYLAFPRILFAWGMDRMGPKWFADIDYRWASPVKNHILCFLLGEIGIFLYAFRGNPMEGLSVTGMEIVSVFGITAIAAAIFPFSKRAKQIWESSPYKGWKLLGIPLVTIGAFVNLIYLAILFYFLVVMPDLEGLVLGSVILYGIVWICGILWYFYWKSRNKQVGVDVSMTFGELPPD